MRDSASRTDLISCPAPFLSHWRRDLLGVPYHGARVRPGLAVALVPCERILV